MRYDGTKEERMKRLEDGKLAAQSQEGVALMMALGMLILFFALGTQYVRYMGLEVKATEFDTGQNQSRQLAYGGIYAAIGKVQAALSSGQAVVSDASIELPVFKTVYEGRNQGISLDRSYETVSVTITESGQTGGLAGALEEAGFQGDALTAVRGRAQAASTGRIFHIASESGSRAAEAIVAFHAGGAYEIRFWREGRTADQAVAETDSEARAPADGGGEASSESDADPAPSDETVEAEEE